MGHSKIRFKIGKKFPILSGKEKPNNSSMRICTKKARSFLFWGVLNVSTPFFRQPKLDFSNLHYYQVFSRSCTFFANSAGVMFPSPS